MTINTNITLIPAVIAMNTTVLFVNIIQLGSSA